jgi:hypothetical protein
VERRSSQGEAEPAAASERAHSDRRSAAAAKPGFLTRLRRNWVLHGIYSYTRAYIPIFALVISLLVLLWAFQTFWPKAPTPLTLAQQWVKIEQKYSPQRQEALAELDKAFGQEWTAQQPAYEDFRDATKGWLDDVEAISDWGEAQDYVDYFLTDGQAELDILDKVVASTTAEQAVAAGGTLKTADATFREEVGMVRSALGLPAVSESPLPDMSAGASMSPVPSASASGSLVPSESPAPSPTSTL